MAKYRYTSNKAADDATSVIIPDPEDRERSVRQGDEIELSDEEAKTLRERFNLTKVDDSDSSAAEERETADTRGGRAADRS